MCGIVGIISYEAVAGRLLDGLKRLEYRGYDSAGIATVDCDMIKRRRASGKLSNLAKALEAEPLSGAVGIAHTRWATHGGPNTDNAHPERKGVGSGKGVSARENTGGSCIIQKQKKNT